MSSYLESTLVQLTAKVTIVLLTAWLAHFALRKWNPRWQVWLWRVTTVNMAIVLFAAIIPPWYSVPLRLPTTNAPVSQSIIEDASTHGARGPGEASHRDVIEFKSAVVAASIANSTHKFHFNWAVCGGVLYCLIAGSMLARLVAGLWIARCEITTSESAPEWIERIAKQMAQESNVSSIPIRVTDRIDSPVLCGVFQNTILLPDAMLQSQSLERDARGAIAHEMAHAATHDLLWDILVAVIAAFVWPHPLSWRARSAHRSACERVSDRVAVETLGDLAAYQSLVARVALRVSKAAPKVGLAMARQSEVRQRLASLANCPAVPRLGRSTLIIVSCIIVVIGLMAVGSIAMQPVPRPKTLQLKVVHCVTHAPIPNAKIEAHFEPGEVAAFGVRTEHSLTTNEDGEATFEYPVGNEPLRILTATVYQPGFVKQYTIFGQDLIPAVLPTEKTIQLLPGKKIGGCVVDGNGKPVSGAEVSVLTQTTDPPSDLHYHLLDTTTEQDGIWTLDDAPLDVSATKISIKHPGFTEYSFQSIQDRVDGQYVLDRGVSLSGRVTDKNGSPIPTAHITVGRGGWRRMEGILPVTKEGTFTLDTVKPESTWVTVDADGYAPQVKNVELNRETGSVDFQLLPGNTTHFKVVGDNGKAVEGASIWASSWNDLRIRTLRWEDETDHNGLATWDSAPLEPVMFSVISPGYAALRNAVVGPNDKPHILCLHRPVRVRGTVIDSDEKKVPEFRVAIGQWHAIHNKVVVLNGHSRGRDGQFEIECTEDYGRFYVCIEAEGFQSWTSDAIPFDNSNQKLVVKLKARGGL